MIVKLALPHSAFCQAFWINSFVEIVNCFSEEFLICLNLENNDSRHGNDQME